MNRNIVIFLVFSVASIYVITRRVRSSNSATSTPDEIGDAFYQQFVDGFRAVVRIELSHWVDRAVIRSLLHSQGIPTAEWFGCFAGVRVGAPVPRYNTVELVVLAEDLSDVVVVLVAYFEHRSQRHAPMGRTKIRMLLETLFFGWCAASPQVTPFPVLIRLDSRAVLGSEAGEEA